MNKQSFRHVKEINAQFDCEPQIGDVFVFEENGFRQWPGYRVTKIGASIFLASLDGDLDLVIHPTSKARKLFVRKSHEVICKRCKARFGVEFGNLLLTTSFEVDVVNVLSLKCSSCDAEVSLLG